MGYWLRMKLDANKTCQAHKTLRQVKKIKLRLNKDAGIILILKPSGTALGIDIDNAGV